eukprot:6468815-Amphidinium_carterae.1
MAVLEGCVKLSLSKIARTGTNKNTQNNGFKRSALSQYCVKVLTLRKVVILWSRCLASTHSSQRHAHKPESRNVTLQRETLRTKRLSNVYCGDTQSDTVLLRLQQDMSQLWRRLGAAKMLVWEAGMIEAKAARCRPALVEFAAWATI